MQCIGIALLMIRIVIGKVLHVVTNGIGIALLMISIVVQCNGINLLMISILV